MRPGAQALKAHQLTLFKHLKHEFFSRNLGQNMPKNAYFLKKKSVKLPQRPGAPPPNPRWSPALKISPPDPRVVTPMHLLIYICRNAFLALTTFYYFDK